MSSIFFQTKLSGFFQRCIFMCLNTYLNYISGYLDYQAILITFLAIPVKSSFSYFHQTLHSPDTCCCPPQMGEAESRVQRTEHLIGELKTLMDEMERARGPPFPLGRALSSRLKSLFPKDVAVVVFLKAFR